MTTPHATTANAVDARMGDRYAVFVEKRVDEAGYYAVSATTTDTPALQEVGSHCTCCLNFARYLRIAGSDAWWDYKVVHTSVEPLSRTRVTVIREVLA